MKHPVRDRILIFIIAILMLVFAAGAVLLTLGMIPMDWITWAVTFAQSGIVAKVIIWAIALVAALYALGLIGIILPGRSKHKKPFATIYSENGAVNISVKAIESLVQKCLQAHPEIAVVSSAIRSDGDSVRITLHITLLEDISIPLAVSALQKEIRQYVQSCAGVEISDVRVFVDTVKKEQIESPYRVPAAAAIATPLSANAEEQPVVEAETPAIEEPVEEVTAVAEEETVAAQEAPVCEEAAAQDAEAVCEETKPVEEESAEENETSAQM